MSITHCFSLNVDLLKSLSTGIKLAKSLKKLDLSWNKLGDQDCEFCSDLIIETEIETLNLAVNNITINGLLKLSVGLRNSSIKNLCLDSNQLLVEDH